VSISGRDEVYSKIRANRTEQNRTGQGNGTRCCLLSELSFDEREYFVWPDDRLLFLCYSFIVVLEVPWALNVLCKDVPWPVDDAKDISSRRGRCRRDGDGLFAQAIVLTIAVLAGCAS